MTINEVSEANSNNNHGSDLSSKNSNDYSCNKRKISKLREAIPQILAVTGKNFLLITFGTTLGYPTILMETIKYKMPGSDILSGQQSWMSSIHYSMMPLGCIFSGPISNYFGRKTTMMLANIPFMASWIILYFATSTPIVLFALALMGLTGGLCEAPVLTYVAEITQPHLRGMLSATATLAVIMGKFTQMITGNFTDWNTTALINITYPIMCFVSLLFLPESPYWLAGKNRIPEAKKSLQWLRGCVSESQVHEEFQTILQSVKNPGNENVVKKESQWQAFKKPTFISPFILIITVFFIVSYGGASPLQTYIASIFKSIKAPIKDGHAKLFLGIAETSGTIISVIIIHFVGRRQISFISIGGTGILFLSCAIYMNLVKFNLVNSIDYSWIPTIFLIGVALFAHLGIRLLPWILVGEVFPASVRSLASGVSAAIYYIFLAIVNNVFTIMETNLTLSGTFIFYAVVNFIGGVSLFFLLPETEGRTLKEIEDHYAGIQSLKIKSQMKKNENNEDR